MDWCKNISFQLPTCSDKLYIKHWSKGPKVSNNNESRHIVVLINSLYKRLYQIGHGCQITIPSRHNVLVLTNINVFSNFTNFYIYMHNTSVFQKSTCWLIYYNKSICRHMYYMYNESTCRPTDYKNFYMSCIIHVNYIKSNHNGGNWPTIMFCLQIIQSFTYLYLYIKRTGLHVHWNNGVLSQSRFLYLYHGFQFWNGGGNRGIG